MSVLVGRPARSYFLYGAVLLLAVATGAVLAFSERLGGDNGPYVLLGALLAIVATGAILFQWRIGALLLTAVLPFQTIVNSGPVVSGTKVLAALTFVSLAMALLVDKKIFERFARLWKQPLALAVLAFVIWISASMLWAVYKGEVLREMASFLGLLGLMAVVGMLERRWLKLVWAGLAFSAALSVPAAYILPQPEDADMVVSGRFGPAGAGPNSYACLMAIAYFVAYFGLLKQHKWTALLLTPVFIYGVFATQSRTGLIALVATPLLALFVPRLASRLSWRVLSMYVLGVAAVVMIVLTVPSVGESALERYSTLSQYQSEETWNGRWGNWEGALDVFASHPILGVGAGNYAEAAVKYSDTVAAHSARDGEISGLAHNIFLGIASELGVVGLVLFLGMLFYLFKAAVPIARSSSLGTGIFLALIVFVFAGMTLSWESQKIVYVLFGSVLSLQMHNTARYVHPFVERDGYRL